MWLKFNIIEAQNPPGTREWRLQEYGVKETPSWRLQTLRLLFWRGVWKQEVSHKPQNVTCTGICTRFEHVQTHTKPIFIHLQTSHTFPQFTHKHINIQHRTICTQTRLLYLVHTHTHKQKCIDLYLHKHHTRFLFYFYSFLFVILFFHHVGVCMCVGGCYWMFFIHLFLI